MWTRRAAASVARLRASGFGPGARAALFVLVALTCACRQDMHDQPKYKPLRANDFFTDMRSERPIIAGTVPRGFLRDDDHLYTGKVNGQDVTAFPFAIDDQRMRRGRERFDIYCSPCHGRTGNGDGMIVRRGYRRPPSYHDERLRQAPVGHFFDVMTNGFGAMPDYATQIAVEDRWAIIAYIRALQLSQHAAASDVPADARAALSGPPLPSAPAPAGGVPR
jgi:mono/diheme cytochrome c family protein